MIYINVKRVLRLRGVENHYKYLMDIGFPPATAKKFLSNQVFRITFENIERFCLALNCTPNDLLEWKPADKQANPEAQALIKLKRDSQEDAMKLITSLPIEKFEQIADILQDLKNQ